MKERKVEAESLQPFVLILLILPHSLIFDSTFASGTTETCVMLKFAARY